LGSAGRYGLESVIVSQLDFREVAAKADLFVTFHSTLALEFIILNIPVYFLAPLASIPIFKRACEAGLALETTDKDSLKRYLKDLIFGNNSFKTSEGFLKSEFTRTDGRVSEELVKLLT
jgi:hypothetical protein